MKNFVTPEKTKHHAQILSNRIKKRYAHMRKRFARQNIDCFRLYDWDIPEVRAVVDWYAGHLVVAEYVRLQTGPDWLPTMAQAVAKTLGVPEENVHVRKRTTKTKEGSRYKKEKSKNLKSKKFVVNERDLKFWINLKDFLDTGLFSDHRDTRVIVSGLANNKTFLNLFAYTGAFTCVAAKGGAKTTVTVDRSATYLKWAKDNMKLNGLDGPQHTFIKSDVDEFLINALNSGKKFNLAVVDPPSFFQNQTSRKKFDINLDHPYLLKRVLKVMDLKSTIFFSTNHQRFEPKFKGIDVEDIKEITPKTIPEDYRNRKIHRCWRITK